MQLDSKRYIERTATCEEREERRVAGSPQYNRQRGGGEGENVECKLWLTYYSQRPFVSACRGTSGITIVIYCLFVWTLSRIWIGHEFNCLLLLLHIKIMMHLSTVSLKICHWWPRCLLHFQARLLLPPRRFVSSSESGTQSSCYHLWTEAEYRWHLSCQLLHQIELPALVCRSVLATQFSKPVLHRSRTP